jgi:hypothetical protein
MGRLRLGLLLFTVSAGTAQASDFSRQPPEPITGFAEWPSISGEVQTTELSFGYRFYVNPERPALYQVMRYRLRLHGEGAASTEKFLWVERPGERVPIRCFELPLGQGAVWREMRPGTSEYAREMHTLIAVLGHQNRDARRQAEADR